SDVLRIILEYINTGKIDPIKNKLAIDVCITADFMLLYNLMEKITFHMDDIEDVATAAPLLNHIVPIVDLSDTTKSLYEILLQPFYSRPLDIGDLNKLSKDSLEFLLSNCSKVTDRFNTTEFVLLLCVLEWGWTLEQNVPPAGERRIIFDKIIDISDASIEPI